EQYLHCQVTKARGTHNSFPHEDNAGLLSTLKFIYIKTKQISWPKFTFHTVFEEFNLTLNYRSPSFICRWSFCPIVVTAMTILPQYFVRLFPVLLLFSSVLGVMTIPLTLCNTEEQLERRLLDAIVKVYAKRVLGEGHTNDPYTSQGIDPRKLKSKEKIIIIFGFEWGLDFHAQNEKWEVKKIVKRPYKGSVLLGTLRFDSTQIKHNFLGLKMNGWITGSTPGFQPLTTPATSDRIHAVNEVILRIRNLKGIKFKILQWVMTQHELGMNFTWQ
ncbi:hypothetical protein F5051DRAFT_485074, partial [Lentinula edodes]